MDASIYATTIDLTDENDAHTLVIRMVGSDKRVLELGCATGSATQVFKANGCTVTAIEIDPDAAQLAKEWADEVIIGDLDIIDLRTVLGDAMFDTIVAADVLEHLKDPAWCLRACLEHLEPDGEVVLSIPNVAHVDVRLALLQGDFDYHEYGLLDNTHLRFFTRRTLEEFIAGNGLVALEWSRTVRPQGETEIVSEPAMDPGVVSWASSQPDADTYQFVLRTAIGADGSHLREVAGQRDRVERELAALLLRSEASESERAGLATRAAELQSELRTMAIEKELQLSELQRSLAEVIRQRDEYMTSFTALASVEDQLVAVRRSESYRIGRAILSPMVALRRVARAWKRAKR